MDYDAFLELMRKRRNIRRFKTDPIPDGYVDKILEAAHWTMSGSNGQTWEFIVVKKEETRKKVLDLYVEYRKRSYKLELTRVEDLRHHNASMPPTILPGFGDAPVLIVVCHDPRRLQAAVMAVHYTSSGDRLLHMNHANVTLSIHLAAASLGLGSQWLTVNPDWEEDLKPLLGVPHIMRVFTIVPIGYPDYTPSPSFRRELKDMVHYDGYDMARFMSEDEVREFVVNLRKMRSG